MSTQLRVYKIKPGMMEAWLDFFRDAVVPLHRKFGIPAQIAWIDDETNEFVWARDFDPSEPIEVQEKRYVGSEERQRLIGDRSRAFIEQMSVRVVRLVHDEAVHPRSSA